MLLLPTLRLALLGSLLGATTVLAAAPAGLQVAGDNADRWVMDNADFVLAINVKQLAASAVMTKGGNDAIKGLIQAEPKVAAVIEATGLDLTKDIDSLLFSGSVGTKDTKGVVIIRGRFDPEKAAEAVKKKADSAEIVKEGTQSMMKIKVMDHNAFAAFIDKNTVVITESKEATAAWCKAGGKNESKLSAAMKSALGNFKGTETLTFSMVLNDDLRKMLGKIPQIAVAGSKLQTVTASLSVSDQAELKVVANASDAKAAKQLQSAVTVLKGLGEVMISADENLGAAIGEVFNEVKITQDDKNVHVSLKVDKALLEKAEKAGKKKD